ncbi:MAG: hypothetical protein ABIJ50_04760 [Pseudomonadota bacterium]
MQTQYNEIINSFVDKYGLSRGQIIAEIEKTLSAMLSQWHGTSTVVLFGDDQLQALRYAEHPGMTLQNQLELISARGWNTIVRVLDHNLGQAACLHEVAHYKRREHEMRWGEIIRKNDDGFLVELEIEEGQPILAECPWNRIGVHERKELSVGQKRAFHLRRIDPILLRGIARVQVTVDRVSKNLVTTLFREQLGGTTGIHVHCVKRYVGHKSFVSASGFLPKNIIKNVSQELREHIQVSVGEKKI